MTNHRILPMLKVDLQLTVTAYDEYLLRLIDLARDSIKTEGIVLYETDEDEMLVEMYAAYLYRSRKKDGEIKMPRQLRWALNNKLMSQKSKGQ